jgi:hypothetical protein
MISPHHAGWTSTVLMSVLLASTAGAALSGFRGTGLKLCQ